MQDWYRIKTWTKADEELFFTKLQRARKDSRAEYLRIQAVELLETNNNTFFPVVEMLLQILLQEYPDNVMERSITLYTLGKVYQQLGLHDQALDYYQQAIDFEGRFPSVKTNAYLDYAELVVKQSKETNYHKAENLLLNREPDLLLPIDKYKVYSLLYILASYNGQIEQAKVYAAKANHYASAETSGLRYHQSVGVVQERDTILDNLINQSDVS